MQLNSWQNYNPLSLRCFSSRCISINTWRFKRPIPRSSSAFGSLSLSSLFLIRLLSPACLSIRVPPSFILPLRFFHSRIDRLSPPSLQKSLTHLPWLERRENKKNKIGQIKKSNQREKSWSFALHEGIIDSAFYSCILHTFTFKILIVLHRFVFMWCWKRGNKKECEWNTEKKTCL